MQRLRAPQHGSQGLQCHPHNIVVRLLRRQGDPGGLGMRSQEQRPWVAGMIALLDFPSPYPSRRTKFSNFLKKITMHIKKERQPWREGIDCQTSRHGLLDVGQPIIQRKRQFLDRCGSSYADMIPTSTDGIPLWEMLCTVGYRVAH